MRAFRWLVFGFVVLVTWSGTWVPTSAAAADPVAGQAAAEAPAAVNPGTRTTLMPEEWASYNQLMKQEIEQTAQLQLMRDLASEHAARAKEQAESGAGDEKKLQWETELADELRTRASALLSKLNETTAQRVAFEAAHAPAPSVKLTALDERKGLNPNEASYVTRIDERLLRVRQELSAIIAAGKSLQSELQTNHTEEAVARVSVLVDANNRDRNQLEKEQSDLELRKLEFKAMRK